MNALSKDEFKRQDVQYPTISALLLDEERLAEQTAVAHINPPIRLLNRLHTEELKNILNIILCDLLDE